MIKYIIYFFHHNIGDWGLGIGDWGLGIGPNPQYYDEKRLYNIFYHLIIIKHNI